MSLHFNISYDNPLTRCPSCGLERLEFLPEGDNGFNSCLDCGTEWTRSPLPVNSSDGISLRSTLHPGSLEEVEIEIPERINHPQHYGGDTPYEVIKVLEAWLTPEEFVGALKFNIIKYTTRAAKKNGLEDYKKSLWYSERLVKFLEKKNEQ